MLFKNFVLLASIALIVAVWGCSEDDPVSPPDPVIESIAEETAVAEGTVTTYQQYLVDNTPSEARVMLAQNLQDMPEIASAGVSEDSITVWWKTAEGIEFLLLTETRASITDTTTTDFRTEYEWDFEGFNLGRELPHNDKALVLSPYQWDWNLFEIIPIADETGFIDNLLSNSGYQTLFKVNNRHSDQNISLDDYKHFNQFGVVAISSHGGVNSDGDIIIATGVMATDALYTTYKNELKDGSLVLVVYIDKWFTDDDILAFAITPKWIEDKYPSKLDSTLFYASACKSSFNTTMSDPIVGSGTGYFGWTHSVGTGQATTTGKDLFTQLVSNAKDCGESIVTVNDHGNNEFSPPIWSSEPDAHFTFVGDSTLYLMEGPIEIATTPPEYDDLGELLAGFGYEYTTISLGDLSDPAVLSQYDVIGINCASYLDGPAANSVAELQDFVFNGGKLYASDFAYIFIKEAFPGKMEFPSYPHTGQAQTLTSAVVDPSLAAYLGTSSVEIVYDLGGWVPIMSIAPGTRSLLTGEVSIDSEPRDRQGHGGDAQGEPSARETVSLNLAASFTYGEGTVVYTSFHNEHQTSSTAKHILEYFTILE